MSSDRQIQANRKNAKRGGVRSSAGKATSRWNALSHGLLSQEVVIATGEGKENGTDFNRVLTGLRTDLQPEGMLEEMLVERMAVAYWRLRRAIRAEAGELRKNLDHPHFDDVATRLEQFETNRPLVSRRYFYGQLRQTSFGIDYFIQELQTARDELERDGQLNTTGMRGILNCFGASSGDGMMCAFFNAVIIAILSGQPVPTGAEVLTVQSCREKMFLILDGELSRLRIVVSGISEIEEDRLNANTAASCVPGIEPLDRLLRYETAIERQFYRAAHELERLQRVRAGLTVTPPLSVDIDLSKDQD